MAFGVRTSCHVSVWRRALKQFNGLPPEATFIARYSMETVTAFEHPFLLVVPPLLSFNTETTSYQIIHLNIMSPIYRKSTSNLSPFINLNNASADLHPQSVMLDEVLSS